MDKQGENDLRIILIMMHTLIKLKLMPKWADLSEHAREIWMKFNGNV